VAGSQKYARGTVIEAGGMIFWGIVAFVFICAVADYITRGGW
jgi:hypothetical protein